MTACWSNRAGPDLFRYRGIGCAELTPQAGDREGAEACAGLSSRRRGGIRELCTWNALDNQGMLEVNNRLAFVL